MNTKEKALKALEYLIEARLLFNEALSEYCKDEAEELRDLDLKHGIASYDTQEVIKTLIANITARDMENDAISKRQKA
jgi:hypothetical protein